MPWQAPYTRRPEYFPTRIYVYVQPGCADLLQREAHKQASKQTRTHAYIYTCMHMLIHDSRHAIRTLSPRLFATSSSFFAAASSRQRISAWEGMAESFVVWSTPKLDVKLFEEIDAAFPMIVFGNWTELNLKTGNYCVTLLVLQLWQRFLWEYVVQMRELRIWVL